MSIRSKLILPLFIALGVFFGVLHFYWGNQLIASDKQSFTQEQRNLLFALEPDITRHLLAGDLAALYGTLNEQLRIRQSIWPKLTLYQNDVTPLYPMSQAPFDKKGHKDVKEHIKLKHRIYLGNQETVTIDLVADWSHSKKAYEDQIYLLELYLLGAISIVVVLSLIWQNHLILSPIDKLEKAARKMQDGNFDAQLPFVRNDEVGSLTTAFNAMRNSLLVTQKELKQALNRVQEQEVRQRTIFETVADGLLTVNTDGNIMTLNPAIEELFGYSADEVLGKNLGMLMPPEFQSRYKSTLDRLLKGRGVHAKVVNFRRELFGFTKAGDTFPIDISISEMNLGGNKFLNAVIRDITQQKKDEQDLIEARTAAEAALVTKSQFLATMSHEIRTPMNGVLGMGELLSDTALTATQKEYVDVINGSGQALLNIINDILDFSKIESGKLKIESVPFDLEQSVFEVLKLTHNAAIKHDLELIYDYETNCPTHFIGDSGRVRQILINLVGNAIKFTPQGFVHVKIRQYEFESADAGVEISIIDSGIGIPDKKQANLFNAFTQADSSMTRKYGGTGLGLAISRQLAELMGGKIGVISAENKGSTFWIRIPLKTSEPVRIRTATDLSGKSVLVIDDHSLAGQVVIGQLKDIGLNVKSSDSIEQSIELLQQETGNIPFHWVIAVNSDKIDGEEFVEATETLPDLNLPPLILLAAQGRRGDGERFESLGYAAYLSQPMLSDVLWKALTMTQGNDLAEQDSRDSLVTSYVVEEAKVDEMSQKINSKHILLAEDAVPNQRVAAAILKQMGCTVDVANNGNEAIAMWAEGKYDLILMDCQMPELNGLDATKIIREQEFKKRMTRIPVIALTANATAEDKRICLTAGMDQFISKPYNRAELISVLSVFIG